MRFSTNFYYFWPEYIAWRLVGKFYYPLKLQLYSFILQAFYIHNDISDSSYRRENKPDNLKASTGGKIEQIYKSATDYKRPNFKQSIHYLFSGNKTDGRRKEKALYAIGFLTKQITDLEIFLRNTNGRRIHSNLQLQNYIKINLLK